MQVWLLRGTETTFEVEDVKDITVDQVLAAVTDRRQNNRIARIPKEHFRFSANIGGRRILFPDSPYDWDLGAPVAKLVRIGTI